MNRMELPQYPTLDLTRFEEELKKLSVEDLRKEKQRVWTYHNKIKAVIEFKEKMSTAHQ